MKATSLPLAEFRKYLAGVIRNQRAAIRRAPCTYPVDLIRKEKLQAKLEQTRFIAKDVAFFASNPEVLFDGLPR